MQSRAKVWPQNLAPVAGSFGGQTIYPNKAAHPGRFEQRLQQQTGSTVNSQQQQQPTAFVQRTSIVDSNSLPNVASSSGTIQPPSVSLASLAAQEWSRQRKEQLLNSGCVESNALVSLNSNLANRANKQNVRSTASLDSALEYSILLPSLSTATLVSHHLATGQLSSWEQALQDKVLSDPGRLDALILESPVNPFPLPGQDYYSIGVSELYNITCERQPVYLSSNAPPLILPLTLARIVQIAAFEMPLKQKQMCSAAYAGGQEEPLPVYWFKTAAPHGYVPGLSFFFMAAPPAVPVQCPPECCDQYNPFEPKNTDRFVVIDTAHCQDALLHGGEQECCFLALRCRSESQCLSAQQARIFAPFDDIEFKKYGCEEPLLVLKDFDFQVTEQLSSLSEESTQSTSCLHYACSSANAFAYVPPPTSPEQLAALVNGTLRRSALVCVNVRCEPLFNASVAYDPLIDQFRIDFGSSCSYVRSLFGDECNVATTLNFPLTRSMMVVSETSSNAQQIYLNRVLHEFFWFKIETDVNDSFQVYFECGNQTLRRTVTIPPGVYVATQFASVLQTTLNNAYVSDAENKKSYQFRVEQKLYATEQLARARAEWATTQSAALLPLAVSTPYTSKTFCFFIEASDSLQLFSLDFSQTEQSRAFARLIDFDPDFCYQLKSSYVGRALAPFYYGSESGARNLRQCLDQIEKCALVCSPCPRRTYSARVSDDQAEKTVALEQRIQRPFQVCKSAWDECSGTMKVKIVDADVSKCAPPIQICAGDVLVASRTNPLCRLCSGDTTEQCALVPVIDVCGPNDFTLAFDPLPAPLLTLNQTDNEEQCAERLQTIDTIWLWSMPVGFNLHLHPATPLQQASSVIYADSSQSRLVPQASQSNPLTRYLGFSTPRTRSGAYLYTSDAAPTSIIDENILLVVPELVPAASSENRHTMYANTTAFDRLLTQVYAQLTLDTQLNQYVAYPDRTGAQLSLCRDLCVGSCTTGITPLASMTVILMRPDGSPYYLNGGQYVLTFEMGFWQQ